jgi:hypothetical protein
VPHHARCPKCRSRFDLRELVDEAFDPGDGRARAELRHDLTRPRLDPSSSSYEIEAISEGFSPDDGDGPSADEWDDDWDGAIESDDVAFPVAADPPVPIRLARLASLVNQLAADRGVPRITTPWQVLLFQAWAVLFIVWAALIGMRAMLATIRSDEALFFSTAMVWPVACVVLLVTGSAGLFLLIDVRRRLTGPTPVALLPSQNGASRHPHAPIEPIVVKPGKLSRG